MARELSNRGKIATNLLYVLADVLETQLKDTLDIYGRENFEPKNENARDIRKACACLRRVVSEMRKSSTEEQINFGDDSDQFRALIWLVIDRCGDDPQTFIDIYNDIKKRKSKLNLSLDRMEHIAFKIL